MARLRKQRGKPPVGPDPKLQGNDRRREITDAALGLFAERSFASVTIKDIAGKLRINPALIYYYFKSKQDLFRSSIEAAILDAVAHYDRIRILHDDPVGLIDAWLDSNVNLSPTISNLVKVMLDVFQPVDQRRVALFASVHLDGVMVAAKIRPDFDLAQAIGNLRYILFSNLGYDHRTSRWPVARAGASVETDPLL